MDRIRNGFWILLARNYDNKQASDVQSAYFVYQAVQGNKVVINTAEEFSQAANHYTNIKVLYLDEKDVQYPQLDDALAIPGTLKIHHVKREGTTLIFKLNSP
jgi:predicted negative regulator of RcsB-dependent stress response